MLYHKSPATRANPLGHILLPSDERTNSSVSTSIAAFSGALRMCARRARSEYSVGLRRDVVRNQVAAW